MANNRNKRKRSEGVSETQFSVLKTRMTLAGIIEFINSSLSEKQLSDIREMGFDGLLSLKTDKIPGDLSYWLVSNFDPFSSSLMDGELPIKDEDIQRATSLPIGPLKVDEATKPDHSEEFKNAVTIWRSQFGSDLVEKKRVLEKMKEQKEGGEEFKRNFIVYIVSTLLMGVKGATVSCRILKCLQDVSLIPKFNWCYYTRQHFINSVLQWKRESVDGYIPMYRGPVLILVFIYLDRVSFKGVRRFGNMYPTLSAWTKAEIKNRIKEEKREAKSFGLGAVEEPLERACHIDNQNKQDAFEEENYQVPTCIDVLAKTAKEFAQAYANFSKAVRCAKCEAPNTKAVCQMAALAEAMVEGFNITQPNKQKTNDEKEKNNFSDMEEEESDEMEDKMEVDDKKYLEKVKLDKGKEKMQNEEIDKVAAAIADDDKFFSDPVVLRLLNEAMDQLDMAFRPQSSKVRKHRPPKSGNIDPDIPQFSLFDSQDSLYVTPGYEDDPPKVNDNTSHNVPAHITPAVSSPIPRRSSRLSPTAILNSVSVEPAPSPNPRRSTRVSPTSNLHTVSVEPAKETTSPPASSPNTRRSTRVSPTSILQPASVEPAKETTSPPASSPNPRRSTRVSPTSNMHTVSVSVEPAKEMTSVEHAPDDKQDNVDPTEKTIMKKRNKDVSAIYKSPFIERNINLLVDLKQAEKEVADFAFTDQCQDSEILFKSRHHELSRSDMKSVISDEEVFVNVVHVWCHLLNTKESLRSPESPLRLFFTLKNEVICKDVDFDKLSLVCFPITSPWKILICVNFISSKIEVIHTMKPKSASFEAAVTRVKNYMRKHLAVQIPKCDLLWSFKIEEFVPKAHITGRDDTGICLMRHMDLYKGKKQILGMQQVETILKRAKVKYCHTILTSDENSLKDKVIKEARCFRMGISKQVQVPRDVQTMTDAEIWSYVFNHSNDEHEVLVDTEWMQVTRQGLCSLQPGQWVLDMVIDVMGIYSTVSNEYLLYIPSTLRNLKPNIHKTIGNQYIKTSYMPEDGSKIKKVFMPFLISSHRLKINYLLDSKAARRSNDRKKQLIKKSVDNVAEVLSRSQGYYRFLAMVDFPFDSVKNFPWQSDGYNCGAYVLKCLEAGDDKCLWNQKEFYKNLDEYRKAVVIKLLRWDKNKRKVLG